MIRALFLIITILFSYSSNAESLDFRELVNSKKIKYIKVKYSVKKDGERLSKIYRRYIKDDSVVSINHPMVQRTMNRNQNIDWNNLKKKDRFFLYIDVNLLDLNKVNALTKRKKKQRKKFEEEVNKLKKEVAQKEFRGSLFYMASYGKFTQKNDQYANVNFLQNSPISAGVSFSYYPKDKFYSLSGSLYFSYLTAAVNESNNKNIDVDPEIGGNIYGEYKLSNPRMSIYGGLDFEKFNTFNLENLQKNESVIFDVNKVVYLTLGVSKSVSLFKTKFFTKLSLSQSIVSKRENSLGGAQNTGEFSGNKILFYLFKRVKGPFFVHSLFKYHWMSGPSDITATRLGVGFGYLF